jgi:hypothetical protein
MNIKSNKNFYKTHILSQTLKLNTIGSHLKYVKK